MAVATTAFEVIARTCASDSAIRAADTGASMQKSLLRIASRRQ